MMLCYVTFCYFMLCYVMLCYAMLCYVMLCYVMLCYVMLCYVMLCYVMLCYVIYAMLCYLMLSYHTICYCTKSFDDKKNQVLSRQNQTIHFPYHQYIFEQYLFSIWCNFNYITLGLRCLHHHLQRHQLLFLATQRPVLTSPLAAKWRIE